MDYKFIWWNKQFDFNVNGLDTWPYSHGWYFFYLILRFLLQSSKKKQSKLVNLSRTIIFHVTFNVFKTFFNLIYILKKFSVMVSRLVWNMFKSQHLALSITMSWVVPYMEFETRYWIAILITDDPNIWAFLRIFDR